MQQSKNDKYIKLINVISNDNDSEDSIDEYKIDIDLFISHLIKEASFFQQRPYNRMVSIWAALSVPILYWCYFFVSLMFDMNSDQFDDFSIQRYPAGSRGIGIHRDGKRYKHIVVIITLSGQSRLFATASRNGETRQRINDRPGRLVLLSADGFAGRYDEDSRPLHGVDCVRTGRLSIGFRSFG